LLVAFRKRADRSGFFSHFCKRILPLKSLAKEFSSPIPPLGWPFSFFLSFRIFKRINSKKNTRHGTGATNQRKSILHMDPRRGAAACGLSLEIPSAAEQCEPVRDIEGGVSPAGRLREGSGERPREPAAGTGRCGKRSPLVAREQRDRGGVGGALVVSARGAPAHGGGGTRAERRVETRARGRSRLCLGCVSASHRLDADLG